MDFEMLLSHCRELRRQRAGVVGRLSEEQAFLRRQSVVRSYNSLQLKLKETKKLAAANLLQHIIDDINRKTQTSL